MKSLVLGIMLVSVSSAFAQNENSTHQLKNRFKAKKTMTVNRPAKAEITSDNSKPKQTKVPSGDEVNSDFTIGVIRVVNGTAFVDIETESSKRRMKPVNLPKSAMVDGQEIQFRYTVADESSEKQDVMVIKLYDVEQVKRR